MPLREDLLTPVPGENPAGGSLRYDRVYDQIKEARTEEDDSLPAGAWSRQSKRADFRLAAKLAGDTLATRSKDLQLAVWLGEALIKLEGIGVLAPVLKLCLELQQQFWDTLHPEIDEGDAGLRVVPLQWAANRYTTLVYATALTRKGVSFPEYKAARALGTEQEASSNAQRQEQREQAIAEGKLTSEEVDTEVQATPKSFYVALDGSLEAAAQELAKLESFCEEKYGDDGPTFRKLRVAIEEVHNLVGALLREKRSLEPDPVAMEAVVAEAEPERLPETLVAQTFVQRAEASPFAVESIAGAAAARAEEEGAIEPADGLEPGVPQSWDDALNRIDRAVAYLAEQAPESPIAFALCSAMRLAELRELAANNELDRLPAPTTELRQLLKRLSTDGDWEQLQREALAAMATPYAQGWLDVYRYLWTSCSQMGWGAQQEAVAGAVRQRMLEFAEAATWSLEDDTPAANADTVLWVRNEIVRAVAKEAEPQREEERPVEISIRVPPPEHTEAEEVLLSARSLAARGDIQGAIHVLARDAAEQPVGRLRYQRNIEIAALCIENGRSTVAIPLLQTLVREVEERRLETWEPLESAARPYALLLQCGGNSHLDMNAIFSRLCAIDPSAALMLAPGLEI